MLRDAGALFGLGCGGASVADVLATPCEPEPVTLPERLSRAREPIACVIGGRNVALHAARPFEGNRSVTVAFEVGQDNGRLHFSDALVAWLQQPLKLEGALIDEEPPQRALLLELAGLDLLRRIETHVGDDIRFAEAAQGDLPHSLDIAIEAEHGAMLPLRLELTDRLALVMADFLDRLQPPEPADFSADTVEIVIEAGSQDISVEELDSLRPGDVVMLSARRPVAVLGGVLVAPVRRQSEGIELDGPFHHRSARAMAGSLADIRTGQDSPHLLHLIAENGRTTMTLGAIDALKPRQLLPLSCFDDLGVDLVIDNRRFGRGELIMIGAGLGVRIVSLMPEAADSQPS